MALRYSHGSKNGTFHIVGAGGVWRIYHEDEDIDGPFTSAQAALDELVGGHCAWPSCGDPSLLGLPDELSEWISART